MRPRDRLVGPAHEPRARPRAAAERARCRDGRSHLSLRRSPLPRWSATSRRFTSLDDTPPTVDATSPYLLAEVHVYVGSYRIGPRSSTVGKSPRLRSPSRTTP